MTEKTGPRDLNKSNAPDPARTYERARPEAESGMGRLDNNDEATPTKKADKPEKTVTQRQGLRQINAEDLPIVDKPGEPKKDKVVGKKKKAGEK